MSLEEFLTKEGDKPVVDTKKEKLMEQGLSEVQAQREAEIQMFSKKTCRTKKVEIRGNIEEQFILSFEFDNQPETNAVLNFFKKGKTGMLDGKQLLNLIRAESLKKFV